MIPLATGVGTPVGHIEPERSEGPARVAVPTHRWILHAADEALDLAIGELIPAASGRSRYGSVRRGRFCPASSSLLNPVSPRGRSCSASVDTAPALGSGGCSCAGSRRGSELARRRCWSDPAMTLFEVTGHARFPRKPRRVLRTQESGRQQLAGWRWSVCWRRLGGRVLHERFPRGVQGAEEKDRGSSCRLRFDSGWLG